MLQSCLWTHFLLLLTGPPEGTLDLVDHWMCLGLLMVLAISALLGFCGTTTGSTRLVLPRGVTLFLLLSNTLNAHLKVCEMLTTLSTLDLISYFRIICT